MGESGILFAQSLVVLGWVYITGLCLVLGMRWVENARDYLEAFVKSICIVVALVVLWGFSLKPALQTVYAYLSDDKTVECVCRQWRDMGLKVLQVGNPYIEF